MTRVVVVGSSNTDMVVKTSRIPGPGETILGGHFLMAAGGKGANQAVAAARLGADVAFVGRLGRDLFGERSLSGLRQEGIDTTYVTMDDEAASGIALILVDGEGENRIAVAPGANARLSPDDVLAAKPVIESADVLLLQLEIPLESVSVATQTAQQSGVQVILNPAPAAAQPLASELLNAVSVLTPNESEAAMLMDTPEVGECDPGEVARSLLARGVGAVVVTLGAQGALLAVDDDLQRIAAPKVEPVDTTAAGDAFNGALAVALGERASLPEAIWFANVCGALTTTRMGAQPSLPTALEVERFIDGLREAHSGWAI